MVGWLVGTAEKEGPMQGTLQRPLMATIPRIFRLSEDVQNVLTCVVCLTTLPVLLLNHIRALRCVPYCALSHSSTNTTTQSRHNGKDERTPRQDRKKRGDRSKCQPSSEAEEKRQNDPGAKVHKANTTTTTPTETNPTQHERERDDTANHQTSKGEEKQYSIR